MSEAAWPFVSVIIPVRNEERYIAGCLASLLRCSYPPERWEIIIADGMSADRTRDAIARVAAGAPVPIRVVDNPRQITPVALNLAIGQARGEIIIRVDAHAAFGEEYVTRCVQVAREQGAANVGGPVTTMPGAQTPMARALARAMAHPFGVGNSAFRTAREAREVDTVPFGCFQAAALRQHGLFDERLQRNQDYELNARLRRAGERIYLDPRLESTYYCRPTLKGVLHHAWVNGMWNALTHSLHAHSFCVRHAIPMVFTLGVTLALVLAALAPLTGLPGWLCWGIAVPAWSCCAVYLALNLLVSSTLALRHGGRLWPALLIAFPSFHFLYGAGLLWGWTRALLRRYPWQSGDGIPQWQDRTPQAYSSSPS